MTLHLLDINDCKLGFGTSAEHAFRPGIAYWDGNNYTFGDLAWPKLKRCPTDMLHRYWMQPALDPLTPPLGHARHSADLIHAQIDQVTQSKAADTLIAVPGHYNDEQLSLILGILQATRLEPVRLIHRSIAISYPQAKAPRILHLELQLHQLAATELHIVDRELTVKRTTTVSGQGLLALRDRLLQVINTAFIDQARFDALRSGKDEQDLADQIDKLLAHNPTFEAEYYFHCQGHTVALDKDQLRPAYQPIMDAITRFGPAQAQCLIEDHSFKVSRFCPADWSIMPIDSSTLFNHVAKWIDLTPNNDAFTLIDTLPVDTTVDVAPNLDTATSQSVPFGLSHYQAVPLKQWLRSQAPSASLDGWDLTLSSNAPELITVNGRLVSRQQKLSPGDTVNINGSVMTLIEISG
jgi:hypothetical protein